MIFLEGEQVKKNCMANNPQTSLQNEKHIYSNYLDNIK